MPLSEHSALIESYALRVKLVVRHCKPSAGWSAITTRKSPRFLRRIDHEVFGSFPGAGPALAPRLLSALGSRRERFASASALQSFSAIAPVTKQSGGKCHIHRRYLCAKFLRQSFHEFARESVRHSGWAAAYYEQQRAKGSHHHAAVRSLAYKWQRIIWRCWQDRTPYDEERYLAALARAGSPLANKLHSKPKETNP